MFKFLIIDTYYLDFLNDFYIENETKDKTYDEHLALFMSKLFGTADFYSNNLKKIGCEVRDVIFNDIELQQKWAREHGIKTVSFLPFKRFNKLYKILNKFPFQQWRFDEYHKILKAQIKYYKPEILYIQDIGAINDRFLLEIKPLVKLIVGQIASPIPKNRNLRAYDLIFTSFPHFVKKFRDTGINAEYLKIAFEPRILEQIKGYDRKYDCTFIGGVTESHRAGTTLLEKVAEKVEIDFWGYGAELLSRNSPILRKYHGEAWGREMYKLLAQSKITINRHIDVAENYANNMRLYEATGMGAMLITDYKDNLNELFEIGREVVAYRNIEELIGLIKYYTANDFERESIAKDGQKRTLTRHTYFNRMKEIIDILPNYMK
jgi:hypothetical protein